MFTPVDFPAITEEVVSALADRFEQGGEPIVVPRFEGRRGHPVCCGRGIVEELLALPVESEARAVIRAHEREIGYVEVADAGVLLDVDDPETYDNLVQSADPR